MDYTPAKEALKKWGISERRVQTLSSENRIDGVIRFGRGLMIPKDARIISGKYIKPKEQA